MYKVFFEEVKFGFLWFILVGGGEVIFIGNYGNSKVVKLGVYDLEVVLSVILGCVEWCFFIEVVFGDCIIGFFVMDVVLFKYSFECSDGGDIIGLCLLFECKDKFGFDWKGFVYRNLMGIGIVKFGWYKL